MINHVYRAVTSEHPFSNPTTTCPTPTTTRDERNDGRCARGGRRRLLLLRSSHWLLRRLWPSRERRETPAARCSCAPLVSLPPMAAEDAGDPRRQLSCPPPLFFTDSWPTCPHGCISSSQVLPCLPQDSTFPHGCISSSQVLPCLPQDSTCPHGCISSSQVLPCLPQDSVLVSDFDAKSSSGCFGYNL